MTRKQEQVPGRDEVDGRIAGRSQRFFEEIKVEFLIHELKDPIAVIETALRLLLEQRGKFGDLTAIQEKTLARALRSSKKARHMLYELLEIGRSEAMCFDCCQFLPAQVVNEVILELVQMQVDHLTKGDDLLCDHGIRVAYQDDVASICMSQDEVKFRQIVSNLIKNALHHRINRVDVRLSRQAEQFILEVIDDGPGVAPQNHDLIFRQYAQVQDGSQTKRPGHGLGLAGARILARCLGGEIEIESEKDRGANFRLNLPLSMAR
jgi:signal transduction histidine kinase